MTTTQSDYSMHSKRHAPYQVVKPNGPQGNPGPWIWTAIWSHMCSMDSYPDFWMVNQWFQRPCSPGNTLWPGLCGVEHYLAEGKIICCSSRLHTCCLIVPFSATSLRLPPWGKSSSYDDRLTDITICSLHTTINVPYCRLHTRAHQPVWCNLNIDSSVKIQCRQWWISWRLAYWRWCWRCTKVNLGNRAGLSKLYPQQEATGWWCTLTGDDQCNELARSLTCDLAETN